MSMDKETTTHDLDEVARRLGVGRQRIVQIIRKYGIPHTKKKRKIVLDDEGVEDVKIAYKIGRYNWKINHHQKHIHHLTILKNELYGRLRTCPQ